MDTKIAGAITKLRNDLSTLRAQVAALAGSTSAALPASETIAGLIELATQTETNTGTDDLRAVTPLKLQNRLSGFVTSAALALKADLASPAFTGAPTAPTAAAGTNTTQIATTAFANAAAAAAVISPSAASETASGILELATQTETDTGTDDLRAVTPLKFKTRLVAYAQPLSANLTTLAGVVSGAMGRTLLTATDAAAAKTSLSLVKADVGLSNVDNTSDANKPVSTAQQTALNLKADLASPALTGTPTAPTAAVGTNSGQIATTAFVSSSVAAGLPAVIDGGTP